MTSTVAAPTIQHARSVSRATGSLARAVDRGRDVDAARERLVRCAQQSVIPDSPAGGDGVAGASEEELLATAMAQLSIGSALLTAESTLAAGPDPEPLLVAAASLEGTVAALESEAAEAPAPQRFDARPGGVTLDVVTAAWAALDEMAQAAASVASATLDQATGALLNKVPEGWRDAATATLPEVGGALARWGLQAVRKGIDILLALVDIDALERLRERIDALLARLGAGQDTTVLLGAAIGVDQVKGSLVLPGHGLVHDEKVVERLATLTGRYDRLCRLLRRTAVLITGVGALLAVLQGVSPQVVVVAGAGLVVVLGATILLGRDHTGASDLPGRVEGVRLALPGPLHGRS